MPIKIAIDAGHGNFNAGPGYDQGAEGGAFDEADITLQWALAGRYLLDQAGIETWLTRDDRTDKAPVGQRDDRAEAAGCTHFVAIHCDSAKPSARGTTTLYRHMHPWVQLVHRSGLAAMQSQDRGMRLESASQHNRLAVLDFSGPACLIEIGFISNAKDRARMLEREARVAFWETIIEGLR